MARQKAIPAQQVSTPRWNINFMAVRKGIAMFSLLSCLVAIGALGWKGLSYGLDFTGGVLIEAEYKDIADLDRVRKSLADSGFHSVQVLYYGSEHDVMVRMPPVDKASAEFSERVRLALAASTDSDMSIKRVDIVGPQVGEDLREKAVLAVLVALGLILLYVAVRFEFKFAAGAVASLLHDVLVILGAFALFGWEFDLTVLAAVLAIIGYSLNDSIVVADRIRENFRKLRKSSSEEIIDYSINQTLDRTILTSVTVWVTVLAMFLFGGDGLHAFSKALLIGVFVGTYSSIYVCSNVALALKVTREDFMPPVKPEDDGRP